MTNPEPSKLDFDARTSPLGASEVVLAWHRADEEPFRLSGFPWFEQDKVFRRMPVTKPGELPEAVDGLADCPAGGQVSFQSDSKYVAVRVKLAAPADMDHMPATGQCGFDLYIGPPFAKRFHRVARYDRGLAEYEVVLFEHPDSQMREFTLNFPLYRAVTGLRIGLEPKAQVIAPTPYSMAGRIAVYGTSITQGGCASRPGMAYSNILSRRFNCEVVNLGFSGSGLGEPEVCRSFATIPDVKLWVLDYEANAVSKGRKHYGKTLRDNIGILRESHPGAAILVVSRMLFSYDLTHSEYREQREKTREMEVQIVEDLRDKGDTLIHFLDGSTLLGDDFDECTVDGVHATDLGFLRIAQGMEPVIRRILGV